MLKLRTGCDLRRILTEHGNVTPLNFSFKVKFTQAGAKPIVVL